MRKVGKVVVVFGVLLFASFAAAGSFPFVDLLAFEKYRCENELGGEFLKLFEEEGVTKYVCVYESFVWDKEKEIEYANTYLGGNFFLAAAVLSKCKSEDDVIQGNVRCGEVGEVKEQKYVIYEGYGWLGRDASSLVPRFLPDKYRICTRPNKHFETCYAYKDGILTVEYKFYSHKVKTQYKVTHNLDTSITTDANTSVFTFTPIPDLSACTNCL